MSPPLTHIHWRLLAVQDGPYAPFFKSHRPWKIGHDKGKMHLRVSDANGKLLATFSYQTDTVSGRGNITEADAREMARAFVGSGPLPERDPLWSTAH